MTHLVATKQCTINLVVDADKPPYLLITVENIKGDMSQFVLKDQKGLRRLATDILEELPAPKKRKAKKKKVH